MTMEYVDNLINKKLNECGDFIKFSYYELRVQENLSKTNIEILLKLASIRLTNLNYNVYPIGEKYIKDGKEHIVETNDYLVAIKKLPKQESKEKKIKNGRNK